MSRGCGDTVLWEGPGVPGSPHYGQVQGVPGSLHSTRTGHQSVSPCRPLLPPPAPTLLLSSQSTITPGLAGRAQMALGHPCASAGSPHPQPCTAGASPL